MVHLLHRLYGVDAPVCFLAKCNLYLLNGYKPATSRKNYQALQSWH